MTNRSRPLHARSSEGASAIVGAIALMVLGALLVSAVFTMLDRSDERSKSRAQRAASVAVVDHALASYEYALESNITDETANFLLNQAAMTRLAQFRPGMKPVSNATFGAGFKAHGLDATMMPNPNTRWSMSIAQPDGTTGWWQTIAVLPPRGGSPNLILYLRTWQSTGNEGSTVVGDPRLVRAELRPGRFSDYQILVDGPLTLGDGLNINGRVHTNGYPDAYLVDQLVAPGRPMKLYSGSPAPPTCTNGAGFSTAKGLIDNKGGCVVTSGPAPKYLENTGERFDLLRGSNHLKMLQNLCGTRVFCGSGTGPWNVTLSGSSMTATSPNGSLGTINAAGGAVVYLTGKVRLSGMLTGGQLTIGVGNSGGFNVNGSATVDLVGNGMIGASTSGSAVLGLVVEGDVIPRIDQNYCPAGLNAAVVSASGTLGIPPQYRVPTAPPGSLPICNVQFRFTGSLGTHYMPLLRLSWTTAQVGYTNRTYRYDSRLLTTAPPMFPTTGPWQTSTWKDADPRCLSAANLNDAECG